MPSAACSNPAVQGRQGPSGSSGPSVAAMGVALDQAWNQRVGKLLPSELNPVSKKINVRTEFSGAGTAEEAMLSSQRFYTIPNQMSQILWRSTLSRLEIGRPLPESCRP